MTRIVGHFKFGLILFQTDDGNGRFDVQFVNDGIPPEFVLMKMRAQLKKMEAEYFTSYNQDF